MDLTEESKIIQDYYNAFFALAITYEIKGFSETLKFRKKYPAQTWEKYFENKPKEWKKQGLKIAEEKQELINKLDSLVKIINKTDNEKIFVNSLNKVHEIIYNKK